MISFSSGVSSFGVPHFKQRQANLNHAQILFSGQDTFSFSKGKPVTFGTSGAAFTEWKKLSPYESQAYVLAHYGRTEALKPDIAINKLLVTYVLKDAANSIIEKYGHDLECNEPLRVLEAGNGGVMQFLYIYELLRREIMRQLDEKALVQRERELSFNAYERTTSTDVGRLPYDVWQKNREDNWETRRQRMRPIGHLKMEVILAEPTPSFRNVAQRTIQPNLGKDKTLQGFRLEPGAKRETPRSRIYEEVFQKIWDKYGDMTRSHADRLHGKGDIAFEPSLPPQSFQKLIQNPDIEIKIVDKKVNALYEDYLRGCHFALAPYTLGSISSDPEVFEHEVRTFKMNLKDEAPFVLLMMDGTRDWPMGVYMLPQLNHYKNYMTGVVGRYVGWLQNEIMDRRFRKGLPEEDPTLPAYPVTKISAQKILEKQDALNVEITEVPDETDGAVREGAHGMLLVTGKNGPYRKP